MKKRSFLKFITALVLSSAMIIAFAGCGSDGTEEEVTTEATTQATTEATTAVVLDDSFNIDQVLMEAGLNDALNAAGAEYYMQLDSNTSQTVGINSARADDLDGVAGTIMAFASGDQSYTEFPDYQIMGEKDGVTYILLLATDVQYNPNNQTQVREYETLVNALKNFTIK